MRGACFVLAALTAWVAAAWAAAGPVDRVGGGSFEAGAFPGAGWEAFPWGGARIGRDAGAGRGGGGAARIELPASSASEYPALKYRLDGVRAGERYTGSVWARARDATGLGGYVVLEFMAADGRRIHFTQGNYTRTGTTDWRELRVSGFVPEGATWLALGLVAHGTGTVWFDDARLWRDAVAPAAFGGDAATLTVQPGRVLCERFLGFGAQGDYFLTLPANTNHGVTEADRQRVERRVAGMRPHVIRTFFHYGWWEPEEGKRTPESAEMRDYVRWVRFLKGIGTEVLLTPWGDCFAYSGWMGAGQSRLPAPGKREAMVRSLVDLVAWLRREQGLTNVRWLALMNEPANDWTRQPDAAEFVRLNRLLDALLRRRGLRQEVRLLGVDDSAGSQTVATEWYRDVVGAGVEYCDGISVHTYDHEYVPGLAPWLADRRRLLTAASPWRRLPLFITEFGYGGETYINRENGKYEYALFLADFAVTALREGAAGALMWCLMDTWYGDQRQGYGLWRHGEEGWRPRPGYFAWSLITRWTRPGSRVVTVETRPAGGEVRAVALTAPDGALSCLIVNRCARPIRAALRTGRRGAVGMAYTCSRESVAAAGDGDALLPGRAVCADGSGAIAVELPASAFVLVRLGGTAAKRPPGL